MWGGCAPLMLATDRTGQPAAGGQRDTGKPPEFTVRQEGVRVQTRVDYVGQFDDLRADRLRDRRLEGCGGLLGTSTEARDDETGRWLART